MAATTSGPVFYGDAPDDHHPWAVHDRNRPQPKIVTPGTSSTQEQPGKPPSDATILFNGKDLSQWLNNKNAAAEWIVEDGHMQVKPGTGEIHTKAQFGDLQLHVEWAAPTEVKGDSQGRGNSGIFLPGGLEIQVLDCYNNPTYPDGTAGGYYGVNPPMANALRPPGEYQFYDIIFRRPVYKNGVVLDPGYVTVMVNGVLVQDHTPLEGPGGHMGRSKVGPFPEKDVLRLQDHGNPVRFRNIWCRELPPRSVEGGTDGYLSTEATMAKRRETAAAIRADAATIIPNQALPGLLRLAESLIYEANADALKQTEQLATQYIASLKALPADKLAAKKDEARSLRDAFNYLARWKAIPADFAPKVAIDQLFKDQNWDKKR